MSKKPGTIVLLHGFWVTPRSWEHWIPRYQARGYKVLAPAYPGFEVEVEALNRDPSVIAESTIPGILGHFENVVRSTGEQPIIMGHSAGGVFTQLLLDKGLGACGVALNSAPTEGVAVVPWSQIKTVFPVLKNPANRHRAVALDYEHWKYGFTNTFSEEDGRAAYERYAIPAPGGIFWETALANLTPGHQGNWVNYQNENRAPLLFIAGEEDHLMPPAVQRSNAKHYNSKVHTELKEFAGRSHFMPGQAGWEEVADYALDWAEKHARV